MRREINKDVNEVIQGLESKIQTLEEKNLRLTDEAEVTLLISLVSEILNQHGEILPLLKNSLERIAVFKNLPFCAIAKYDGDLVTALSLYSKYSDESKTEISFSISNEFQKKILNNSSVYYLKDHEEIELTIRDEKREYFYSYILIIPFHTRYIPNGLFICADENETDRLTNISLILNNIVSMITGRIDNMMLLSELQTMNHELENRVEERAQELINVYKKLEFEKEEKIRTEISLHLSESKFKAITEQLTDVIFLTDSKGRVTYVSLSAGKMFGWSANEIIGKIFTEFLDESEIPRAYSTFSSIMNNKIGTEDLVMLMKRKDGSTFYGELHAAFFEYESDFGTLGMIRDISKRKESEEEIKLTNLELLTLNRIIAESANQLDAKLLLQTILDEALKICGLDCGTVCLVTHENTLSLCVERNTSDATKLDLETNQIVVGDCLCGYCALEQKPLILCDREEVLKFASREALRGEDIRFHAAFPIVSKSKSIGVLCVFTYTDKKPSERSLKLIETITAQISLSLENANLYEQIQNNLVDLEEEISERKYAEDALLKSESRYRDLIEFAVDGIIVGSKEGIIIDANSQMLKLTGRTLDNLIGIHISKLFEIEELNLKPLRFDLVYSGETVILERKIVQPNGKIIPIEMHSKMMPDETFQSIFHDITERKTAEAELRKNEMYLRKAEDTARIGNWVLSLKDYSIISSDGAKKIYGVKDGDFTLSDVQQFPLLEYRSKLDKALKDLIEHNMPYDVEFKIQRQNDGEIVDIHSIAEYDPNNKTIFGVLHDVTDRNRSLKLLRDSENLYRQMNNNSPLGMHFYEVNKDKDLIFIGANPAADTLLGVDHSQFIGKILEESSPLFANEEIVTRFRQAALNGKIWSTEEITYKNGKIESAFEVRAFQTTPGKMVAVFMDIAERKKAEDALHRLKKAVDTSREAIFLTDKEGIFTSINPAFTDLYGFTADEVVGKTTPRILKSGQLEQSAYTRFWNALMTGNELKGEFINKRKDGSLVNIEGSANQILDENNEIIGFLGIQRDITERKKIEEALIDSEEIFTQFMKHSPIYLFFKDEQIKSLRLSDNYEKMLGRPINELLGKSMDDLFPSDLAKKMIEDDKRILNEGKEINIEEEMNGRLYSTIKFPINVGGKPRYLAGFTIDITERKKNEEEISMLATALRNVNECVSITDADNTILFVNDSFLNTYGYSKEELLGKNIKIIRSQNDPNIAVEEVLSSTLNGGWKGELINKRKDGSEFPVSLSSTIVERKDGRPNLLIGIAVDITERKRAEEEIKMLAAALKNINESISITDVDDNIIFVNEAFLKTYGYTENELIGKSMRIVSSPNTSHEVYNQILSSTLNGGWQGELLNKRKDGTEFPIHLSTTVIRDKNGKPLILIGVASDITEIKRAERELREAKESAELSDKLKTEFLAQMSHEIRTPINIITSNISFINEELKDKIASEDLDCFTSIGFASKRIIRTVDLILNMSELQTGAYQPVLTDIDLDSEVLQYLYNEFCRSAKEKGVELIYRSEVPESRIKADLYSITQIFANLIDNAIKYTKDGKIDILLAKDNYGNMMVDVKDTGIGINKDFLPHIFEPFVQEEQGYTRAYEGNGLGLSLVKKYCEINNAKIDVESEKNVGTTFRITLGGNFAKNI